MKFVMSQAICPEGMALLDNKAEIYVADNPDPNNYLEEMRDADAVILRIARMDAGAINSSPNLRVIGRTGVGYDSIDVKAATAAGIPIVITPGANDRSVAEHAVAMMFASAKNLVEGHIETTKGNFAIRGAAKAFEMFGKKVGFIGLGSIGQKTADICRGIGMETLAYDPFFTKEQIELKSCVHCGDYEEMMSVCDFISIHVPMTHETENMIAKKQLEMMKKTAILINCARGGIVNEQDLADALNNGRIAGAAIDVYAEEPPSPEIPLMCAKNLICSPHSAAQTREAVVNMAKMCVEGCLAVLAGEKWPQVANPRAYDHPRWQ